MTQVPHHIEKGSGEVVLFLHGVDGGAHSWTRQIDNFSTKYKAAAWDMPGYGKSPLNGGISFPQLADSLLALLDERGWQKVHLVGHSMGGMVAQEFAVAHQDRIHSLTLAATSPAFGNPDGDFQKKFVEARLAALAAGKTMADLATELVKTMMSADADPDGRQLAHDCMADVPAETYRAAVECIVTFEGRTNLGQHPGAHIGACRRGRQQCAGGDDEEDGRENFRLPFRLFAETRSPRQSRESASL